MEAYSEFAQVYDLFMDNVPYEEWCEYLCSLLKDRNIEDGLILELGCGTGNMTELLASKGFDMIGIDNSDEMLNIALEKKEQSGHDILYLHQDMREFELYGTVRAVISLCDSMNYITESEELLQVFRLVNNYLDIGGVFIFDLNTVHKYEQIGDTVIAENREDTSFIWENCYYPEERMNEYELTLFIKDASDKYDKYVETHYQRAYGIKEIESLLSQAGLELLAVYDAFTKEPPGEESERVYFVAKEQGKSSIEPVD